MLETTSLVSRLNVPMDIVEDNKEERRDSFVERVMRGEIGARQIFKKYSDEQRSKITAIQFLNRDEGVEFDGSTIVIDFDDNTNDVWHWKFSHIDDNDRVWYGWRLADINEG